MKTGDAEPGGRRRSRKPGLWLTLPLLVSCLVIAGSSRAEVEGPAGIRACMQENLPKLSSEQTVRITTVDRIGSSTLHRAKIYWKRFPDGFSRVLVRFSDPQDLRGSTLLLIEKEHRSNIFMYLPSLRKVRRVTQHMMAGSMFGTDFSYEDFERLQGMADGAEEERLPDQVLDGRDVFVLQQTPAPGASQYKTLRTFVDQETCIPVRTELWEKGDRLRKVLSADPARVTREASGWIPHHLKMEDRLDETYTELEVEEIRLDQDIARKHFSERALVGTP